ncbi:carotenoid oxygenase family protein [Paraburkholderia strydomiana]|uniref:carotenoid oxygenase family protein n=1 Tax=Paraburkholderia strydomiana TaxID=1245417 RepID=UPI001BE8F09B|nr:carotenoid oxygenase family protein [Paraburkholderia strydomiana]MBT2793345.1 carotenoid oxygenase family protein [Paraburkholderia strydomiana]
MTTINLNSGATAAVLNEVHLVDLPVTGAIPQDLNGVLVRNGPNPLRGHFNGNDVLDWWPEDAMLHGICLQSGRATSYRNRWIRTKRWADVHDPDASPMLLDTNPNVNVLFHAGEILALAEGGVPLAITAELETLGATRSHPGLASGMTAHPKVDPQTGELMSFRADWKKPYLRYAVTDANGMPSVELDIEMSSPSMMHDMAITATRSIFLDLNVGYDVSMVSRGHRMPLRWRDDHKPKLGIIPRNGGDVRWFEIAPCFIQHVVNAYDADEATVVLDAVRYPRYFRLQEDGLTFEPAPLGVLWRYVVDLDRGTVIEKQMADICIELPRINEGRTGRPYRFVYAAEQPTNTEIRGVVRYDLESGLIQRYMVPEGDSNSEPVFIARPTSSLEDDGWLLVCVYRHATDTTELVILDSKNIEITPIATITLPRRIPAGFHGAWLAKDC